MLFSCIHPNTCLKWIPDHELNQYNPYCKTSKQTYYPVMQHLFANSHLEQPLLDEIWLVVFSFLGFNLTTIFQCSCVCKRWNQLLHTRQSLELSRKEIEKEREVYLLGKVHPKWILTNSNWEIATHLALTLTIEVLLFMFLFRDFFWFLASIVYKALAIVILFLFLFLYFRFSLETKNPQSLKLSKIHSTNIN